MSATLTEVARTSRATYRQLDYWIRTGCVWIDDGVDRGSGIHRQVSDEEAADLAALAVVVERAWRSGIMMRHEAISAAWAGLRSGKGWRLVLDVNEGDT